MISRSLRFALPLGLFALIACSSSVDPSASSDDALAAKKKPICTVDSVGDCGNGGGTVTPTASITSDYATDLTTTSATIGFSTPSPIVDVTVVVGPGFTAPATPPAASAAVQVVHVNEAGIYHTKAMSSLAPCTAYYYGLYDGGSLVTSGRFNTTTVTGSVSQAAEPPGTLATRITLSTPIAVNLVLRDAHGTAIQTRSPPASSPSYLIGWDSPAAGDYTIEMTDPAGHCFDVTAAVHFVASTCGDAYCDPARGESCSSCSRDCGACPVAPVVCGDHICTAGRESCSNCATDCGACPTSDPQAGQIGHACLAPTASNAEGCVNDPTKHYAAYCNDAHVCSHCGDPYNVNASDNSGDLCCPARFTSSYSVPLCYPGAICTAGTCAF